VVVFLLVLFGLLLKRFKGVIVKEYNKYKKAARSQSASEANYMSENAYANKAYPKTMGAARNAQTEDRAEERKKKLVSKFAKKKDGMR
jgi:hypothetical protein